MKVNLSRLLKVAGRLVIAAPAIIDAVRSVLRKRPKAMPQPGPVPTPPTDPS